MPHADLIPLSQIIGLVCYSSGKLFRTINNFRPIVVPATITLLVNESCSTYTSSAYGRWDSNPHMHCFLDSSLTIREQPQADKFCSTFGHRLQLSTVRFSAYLSMNPKATKGSAQKRQDSNLRYPCKSTLPFQDSAINHSATLLKFGPPLARSCDIPIITHLTPCAFRLEQIGSGAYILGLWTQNTAEMTGFEPAVV